MSGGHFGYTQYDINEVADEIGRVIASGERALPADIIEKFEYARRLLEEAAIYTQRIDWLLSDDDGEDSFRERLASDLSGLEARAPAVPPGYVLVPLEPTPEMMDARDSGGEDYAVEADEYHFRDRDDARRFAASVYKAMLAVALKEKGDE